MPRSLFAPCRERVRVRSRLSIGRSLARAASERHDITQPQLVQSLARGASRTIACSVHPSDRGMAVEGANVPRPGRGRVLRRRVHHRACGDCLDLGALSSPYNLRTCAPLCSSFSCCCRWAPLARHRPPALLPLQGSTLPHESMSLNLRHRR